MELAARNRRSRTERYVGTAITVLTLILATAACAPSEQQAGSRPNVLLITLDTLRADRLGCYGYEEARTPTLDALAARGTLFEQAYTPAPMTLPAHAARAPCRSSRVHPRVCRAARAVA